MLAARSIAIDLPLKILVAEDAREGYGFLQQFSVHPGGVVTDLIRYMSTKEVRAYGVLDERGKSIIDPARNMKTAEQGRQPGCVCYQPSA